MLLVKQSHYNQQDKDISNYINTADSDLNNIFNALKGRIRFGDGNNGSRGENISGNFAVFTSDGSANNEFEVKHNLGAIPVGFLVIKQNKAGSLYSGTTVWTSTSIFLKCSVASVAYSLFLLK